MSHMDTQYTQTVQASEFEYQIILNFNWLLIFYACSDHSKHCCNHFIFKNIKHVL